MIHYRHFQGKHSIICTDGKHFYDEERKYIGYIDNGKFYSPCGEVKGSFKTNWIISTEGKHIYYTAATDEAVLQYAVQN